MGNELSPTQPDHPTTIPLGAEEVEAIKVARRGLVPAMQQLVRLTQARNSSQSRQAIELLFQYGLANRQQQFDFVTGEAVEGGDTNIALTLNKVEIRLAEVMQNLPPELAFKAAEFIEEIERHAAEINLNIIDGEIIEEVKVEEGPPCACGCGQPVSRLKSNSGGRKRGDWAEFIHGHHLRGHMTHKRIPPNEIKRLKEAGQWDQQQYGIDKKKAAAAKKAAIKAKKARKIEDVVKGVVE